MRFNRSLKKILEDGQPSTYNLQDTAYNIQKKKKKTTTFNLQASTNSNSIHISI